MSLKTLKFETFFYRKILIPKDVVSISDLYPENTTFFLKLLDGTWALYQEKNREWVKGYTLFSILSKTYGISEEAFYKIAVKLNRNEWEIIEKVFVSVDNYNLSRDVYIIP